MQTREADLKDAVVAPPGEYSDVMAEDFTYSRTQHEDNGAGAFVEHHRAQLKKFGLTIGKDGYSVLDLHAKRQIYNVELPGMIYRGGVDAGVVPYNVAEESAGGMLRAAFEHKFPAAAKKTSEDPSVVRSFQGLARLMDACPAFKPA